MLKLFISQPMKGKTDEEILGVRENAIDYTLNLLGEEVHVIDSYFQHAPVDAKPLWFLGKSIELMSTADVVYFADEWEHYRGCAVEHECAKLYGLNIIHD